MILGYDCYRDTLSNIQLLEIPLDIFRYLQIFLDIIKSLCYEGGIHCNIIYLLEMIPQSLRHFCLSFQVFSCSSTRVTFTFSFLQQYEMACSRASRETASTACSQSKPSPSLKFENKIKKLNSNMKSILTFVNTEKIETLDG